MILKTSENEEIEVTKNNYLELKEIRENIYENINWYAWRRYFAKMFDIFFSYIILSIIPIIYFYNNNLSWENLVKDMNFLLLYFYFSPIIYEILFFSLFWNTIWKKLMWIKITNLNWNKLSFLQSIKRAFLSLIWWLWFRLPLIWIFAIITQYKKLISKETNYYTWYDYWNYIVKYKIKVWFLNKIIVFSVVTIYFLILMLLNYLPKAIEDIKLKEKSNIEISKNINTKFYNKSEKELFLEELKKKSWTRNEKIDEITIHTETKLEESNWKYVFVYTYKTTKEKNYFLNNFSEIMKWNSIKEFKEIKKNNKDFQNLINMVIKYNVYFGFKYYDKNNDLISYFEITPKELSELDNISDEIEAKDIENNNWSEDFDMKTAIIVDNTNLRVAPGISSTKKRVIKKWEKISYDSKQYITEKDWYDWIEIFTEKWEN